MHRMQLPENLATLTDVDYERWQNVMRYLLWFRNSMIGGTHFSLAPTTPIAASQVANGELGFQGIALRTLTASLIAAGVADEQHFDDEAVLHRFVDWSNAVLERDGSPGFGILSGMSDAFWPFGKTVYNVVIGAGDQTPRKAIVLPIRPVCTLYTTVGIDTLTAPVFLYPHSISTGGFQVSVRSPAAIVNGDYWRIHWTVATGLLP